NFMEREHQSLGDFRPIETDGNSAHFELRTLDSYAFPRVDFLKIDVGGHEYDVVEGSRETLIRCQPFILLSTYEGGLRNRGYNLQDLFDLLSSMGYRAIQLSTSNDYIAFPSTR